MSRRKRDQRSVLADGALWYKDAIIYEIHIRAFSDSNSDGIGDLRGLVDKLDYIQDLGVTALWLLPFYPSPLRDDGYDISDYTHVNPIYGSLGDFKLLLREAHRRGLRVISELVVNHTSDQHPWFQRARRAPSDSSWRNFYVWNASPDKYKEARIIFGDFESSNWTWDTKAQAYYWHRFYSHQPDLNYDNPAVREAVVNVLDFWLGLGVDGMRLDAVPYLYEREGTNCENLPETHELLKKLRHHVDERFPNRMLLGEANQWPEDAVAYFGAGDECHMAFHFPLMPRLFMAIRMEDRFPVLDIMRQTPIIPETSQWALFLRNHDELTLEMVTDEDRDYMYRVYAQDTHARVNLGIRRRLAPLLENHRGKIELMNGLLFSLPGTPVIYYGDEIGMGDNIYLGDRNGVRTPMQWDPERNAGFSQTNPQRLYLPVIIDPEYHYQTINVESQQNNPHSLLWWMKRLIALRKRYLAFGRGTLDFLNPDNRKVLAFVRRYHQENILVVANLSRSVQCVQLDLTPFKGMMPVEMFGRTILPVVGDALYLLTLGPYAFYWLALEPQSAGRRQGIGINDQVSAENPWSTLTVVDRWQHIFDDPAREDLEGILLGYLRRQFWFTARGGDATFTRMIEIIPIPNSSLANAPAPGGGAAQASSARQNGPIGLSFPSAYIVLAQVDYTEGEPRIFVVPVAFAPAVGAYTPHPGGGAPLTAEQIESTMSHAVLCRLRVENSEPGTESQVGILYDALMDKSISAALLESFARHRRFRGADGEMLSWTTPAYHRLRGWIEPRPEATFVKGQQHNTSIAYGNKLLLKVFRCVEYGVNPEIEIGQALAVNASFTHVAPLAGALEYHARSGKEQSLTVAVLEGFVAHEGDAWSYTLDALRQYFVQVLAQERHRLEPLLPSQSLFDLMQTDLPPMVGELVGPYLEAIRLMGQRAAQLHVTMASITDDPAFAPEPFTLLYQRSLYQTVRTRALRTFDLLREQLKSLSPEARADAERVLAHEGELVGLLRPILERRITAQRIRCHLDYRLENLLHTGKDFVVIDFEGDVSRLLSNRRHKRSPMRDVANLLHSLYFAVRVALKEGDVRPEDMPALEPWARFWVRWTAVAFLKSYLEEAAHASFLPKHRDDLQILLDFYLLSRGVAGLRAQLLDRSDRVRISLLALLQLLELRERRPSGSDGHTQAAVKKQEAEKY
jgi:maltose alpha-D-glucosyltransferase/alpha-amylase